MFGFGGRLPVWTSHLCVTPTSADSRLDGCGGHHCTTATHAARGAAPTLTADIFPEPRQLWRLTPSGPASPSGSGNARCRGPLTGSKRGRCGGRNLLRWLPPRRPRPAVDAGQLALGGAASGGGAPEGPRSATAARAGGHAALRCALGPYMGALQGLHWAPLLPGLYRAARPRPISATFHPIPSRPCPDSRGDSLLVLATTGEINKKGRHRTLGPNRSISITPPRASILGIQSIIACRDLPWCAVV